MYRLVYFAKTKNGICKEDFKNKRKGEFISLHFIQSVSELETFTMPISGTSCIDNKYSIVTMSNDVTYYIDEVSYNNLLKNLNI